MSDYYNNYTSLTHWKKRKADYYKTHKYQCTVCTQRRGLELHHKSYASLFHEYDWQLCYLCRKCHQRVHYILWIFPVPKKLLFLESRRYYLKAMHLFRLRPI